MKRSQVNKAVKNAQECFHKNSWVLPPNPKWDVTDFGLGHFLEDGLVLINLADEPEYCEKLMYAIKGQTTPCHSHRLKKEDIIVRVGQLAIHVWDGLPNETDKTTPFRIKLNGEWSEFYSGDVITLKSGERVTLTPGIYHKFYPLSDECIIGEVSTANDDVNDNLFTNPDIGRFSEMEEDEPAIVNLISD